MERADWWRLRTAGTRRLMALALIVGTGLVATGLAGGGPTAAAGTTPPTSPNWRIATQIPAPLEGITELACSTATTCVAQGSPASNTQNSPDDAALMQTVDGGRTWAWSTVPPLPTVTTPTTAFALGALACAPGGYCLALDDGLLASTDAGATWSSASLPTGLARLWAVACPSGTSCAVVGTTGTGGVEFAETADSGASWATSPIPGVTSPSTAPPSTSALSCHTTTDCLVMGPTWVSRTTDGGVTWTTGVLPTAPVGTSYDFTGLTCPSASECLASGVAMASGSSTPDGAVVYATADGGAAWTAQPLPGAAALAGVIDVSCRTISGCTLVAGSTTATTTNGGQTWTAAAGPAGVGNLDAVDCPTVRRCLMGGLAEATAPFPVLQELGGQVFFSTDGGMDWSVGQLPAGATLLDDVACSTAHHCVAVGIDNYLDPTNSNDLVGYTNTTLVSNDGGATWKAGVEVDLGGGLASVACPTAADCVAVGANLVLVSTDGGQQWSTTTLPELDNENLVSVACASPTSCVAVGRGLQAGGVIVTTDDFWATAPTITQTVWLDAVSCPAASTCIAVGQIPEGGGTVGYAEVTSDGGATWTGSSITGTQSVWAESCPAPNQCLAVAYGPFNAPSVIESTDGGTTWTTAFKPAEPQLELGPIACGSTTRCVVMTAGENAGDVVAMASADGGQTWSDQTIPGAPLLGFGGVECRSATNCLAVASLLSPRQLEVGSAVLSY